MGVHASHQIDTPSLWGFEYGLVEMKMKFQNIPMLHKFKTFLKVINASGCKNISKYQNVFRCRLPFLHIQQQWS